MTAIKSTKMNGRSERVMLETQRYRIVGDLMLPRTGYRSRLSDFLNASDRDFVSLTGVTMTPLDERGDPGEPIEREFITVARQHIVLASTVPADAPAEPAPAHGNGAAPA